MSADEFEWVTLPEYDVDAVEIENCTAPNELAIFDVREETGHDVWITALEGSYVDTEAVR